MSTLPIAIYYEQPHWFKPLFAELDRRGTPYVALSAVDHTWSPADHPEEHYSLVFNRMSPSAWNRDHGDQIFYTLGFLEHLEARGVRVINGIQAFRSELSKAGQLTLMDTLGLGYPKARVIIDRSAAPAAAEGLRFPVVVKPNIGGSGAGVKRFDTSPSSKPPQPRPTDPTPSPSASTPPPSSRSSSRPRRPHRPRRSPQRQIPLRHQGHITGETFDLCPADICRTPRSST